MKIAIIEDEINAFEHLSRLLQQIDTDIVVDKHCESIKTSVIYLSAQPQIDLIFMDIQLADGLSFDIFDHISLDIPVIFVTAYDTYAIDAFKVHSVDYLLKPIRKEDLQKAIEKFHSFFQGVKSQNISELLESLQLGGLNNKKRCLVKRGNHYEYIDINTIAFVHSQDSITFLYTMDGQRWMYGKTVEQLIQNLSSQMFFQISRRTIVHIQSIKEVHPYMNQRMVVKLHKGLGRDFQLLVSRGRATAFKKWLDK